jgi:hypothetical protein
VPVSGSWQPPLGQAERGPQTSWLESGPGRLSAPAPKPPLTWALWSGGGDLNSRPLRPEVRSAGIGRTFLDDTSWSPEDGGRSRTPPVRHDRAMGARSDPLLANRAANQVVAAELGPGSDQAASIVLARSLRVPFVARLHLTAKHSRKSVAVRARRSESGPEGVRPSHPHLRVRRVPAGLTLCWHHAAEAHQPSCGDDWHCLVLGRGLGNGLVRSGRGLDEREGPSHELDYPIDGGTQICRDCV